MHGAQKACKSKRAFHTKKVAFSLLQIFKTHDIL